MTDQKPQEGARPTFSTHAKDIRGRKYTTTVFPATLGIKYAMRLADLIGPAAAKTIEGIGQAVAGGMAESLLGDAVRDLLNNTDIDDTQQFILQLCANTQCDGKPLTEDNFNVHFAGNYAELRDVLGFVVEANNFMGFFDGWLNEVLDGVGAIRNLAKTAFSEPSNEQQTSELNGGSGPQ